MGLDVIIRDSSGRVMACCAQGLNVYFPPPIAEALAIRRGLLLAIETGSSRVCIESDAAFVVNLIVNRNFFSRIGVIIADILLLFNSLEVVSVAFVARKANHVAYRLAKFGLSFIDDFVWLEDCPLCVENMVLNNCSS
ncbi:hypothetical protein ACOSP7_012496 [Xanthoceras sorbifolium]